MNAVEARSFGKTGSGRSSIRSGYAQGCALVAIVSKADRCGGGASLVAEELAAALNEEGNRFGFSAEHWLVQPSGSLRPFQRIVGGRIGAAVVRRLHWLTRHLGCPDLIPWEYLFFRRHLRRFCAVHFHDCSSAIANHTIRWTARRVPTVWTFHDCSPLTAGCLYPMDCSRFERGCGSCPQLHHWPFGGRLRWDCTRALRTIRARTAAEHRFTAVAPSNWMAQEAVRSGMFSAPPRVIPNFVDSTVFRPYDRSVLRAELGMSDEFPWVLISAGSLADPRKGVGDALEAVRRCGRKVGIVLVGRDDPSLRVRTAGIETRITGFVSEPNELARWYAAANVLLFPSRADNLPCTILEAMACGTPTIGYEVGGVPDLIVSERNGRLVPAGALGALTAALTDALARPELLRRWGTAARERALTEFGRERFVRAHCALYADLCAGRLGEEHRSACINDCDRSSLAVAEALGDREAA